MSRLLMVPAMVLSLAAAAAPVVALGVAAVAPPGSTTEPSAGAVLPSETCRGLFILPVTVGEGEGKTLQLLLDTGSSWTFVDPGAVQRVLDRPPGAGKVLFRDGRIGAHALGSLRARVYPMGSLSLAIGHDIDGILGFPAFKDVLLTLDYPAGEIRVSSGRLPPADGHEVFRDAGGKRPELKIDIGGRRAKVLLDSGANGAFKLKPSDRLTWAVEPRPVMTSMTFWGVTVNEGGRLNGDLQFGSLRFEDAVVLIDRSERLAGWQVLHHFVLTFDQKSGRIRMQPRGTGPVRLPSLVGSGLGLHSRPQGLMIIRVFPGTSAAAAGLRAGDLITGIDGVPVHERECADPSGEAVGRRQVLSYLRDSIQSEAVIETGVLIP